MEGDTLYRGIRLDFFQKVYSGEIEPNQQLPPERKQAQELSVSRGTIRKARQLLEEEGYISNTQGSGAVYTPLGARRSAPPEIIAVLVPVHNPFFMSYYRAFEREAEGHGILVVIKQLDHYNVDRLKEVLFSLFMKGIRDIVFWPYDTNPDYRYIERLSGLGMNVVFFDTVRSIPSCDYVSVDNRHGVDSLYAWLKKSGAERITYLGWDSEILTSGREREDRFREIMADDDRIIRLPWHQEELASDQLEALPDLLDRARGGSEGFLCGNGPIGLVMKKFLAARGLTALPVASMDNFEESKDLGLTVYEQPFEEMGRQTFLSLRRRSEEGRPGKPQIHYIKGRIIGR